MEPILAGYCFLDYRSAIDQANAAHSGDNVRSDLECCLFIQVGAEAATAGDIFTYPSTSCHRSLP